MVKYDQVETGKYIKKLMDANYKFQRDFCRAYIKITGLETEDKAEEGRVANKVNQILQGKKGITTSDLPVFSELLGVSCEMILGAGKTSGKESVYRLTNYTVAQSSDVKVWEEYANHPGTPLLNPDEYGKYAITYAFEFENFEFIKYLMNKGYIWFDSRKDEDYVFTFGAGTSLKRKNPNIIENSFEHIISTEDKLRLDIITLAVKKSDKSVLEELRAREMPGLYGLAQNLFGAHPDFKKFYNKELVQSIAKSNRQVIEYFTEEFEIDTSVKYSQGSSQKHKFLYPYINELINALTDRKSKYVADALEVAIKHNKDVLVWINEAVDSIVEKTLSQYPYPPVDMDRENIVANIKNQLVISPVGNTIRFVDIRENKVLVSNIAYVDAKTEESEIQRLIDELNSIYDQIVAIGRISER